MGGSTDRELLFCETFNHEGSQVRPFTHAPTEPQSFAPEQRFYLVRTTTHSSHSPQGLHVDLMRFPLPVVVKEVRIVSPDITVCPELPMKIGSDYYTETTKIKNFVFFADKRLLHLSRWTCFAMTAATLWLRPLTLWGRESGPVYFLRVFTKLLQARVQ